MKPARDNHIPHSPQPEELSAARSESACFAQAIQSNSEPGPAISRLVMGLYSLGLMAGWPLRTGYCLLRAQVDGKYRDSLRVRAGLELPRHLSGKPRVWFHALSVGEILSVVPLIKAFKERRPDFEIIVSSSTETGQSIAKKQLAPWVERFSYLPYDLPWVMECLVKRHKPSLFVLVETDIWPNLLQTLQRHRVPGVLVNGRLSPRSSRRMRRLSRFWGAVLRYFTYIFAQSAADGERYRALGVPAERIRVSGNLKYDAALLQAEAATAGGLCDLAGIEPGRLVWIAGSTHDGEEDILLRVHRKLRALYPDLLLILAPRQIQRTPRIKELCRGRGLTAAVRSRGQSARGKAVYLLDTLGELNRCYSLADVAYIGGSLVAFGGHNPIEAVVRGKPAVWGPHLFNFREIETDLIQSGCGRSVANSDELLDVVGRWLGQPNVREAMQSAAEQFLARHGGTSRILAGVLDELLSRC